MTFLIGLLGHAEAQRLALALLHFLWQGLVVAAVAWLVLAALRRSSASARYLSLVILFAVLAACPVVTFGLIAGDRKQPIVARALVAEPNLASNRSATVASADEMVADTSLAQRVSLRPMPERPAQALEDRAPRLAAGKGWSVQRAWVAGRDWIEGRLAWVVAAWLLGVCVFSLRLVLGWVAIERLKRVAVRPVGGDLVATIEALAHSIGISRPVRLLQSTLAEVPAVIGCLKPVILLPVQACIRLPVEQLEAILAHELAHIKRCDYAVNCAQALVETLLFYHPAVWWMSQEIRRERERCCDDVAVSLCGDRFVYVKALTAMEGLRGRAPGLAMAAGSRGGPLRRRVHRLLGVPHEPAPMAARWLAAAALMGMGIAVGSVLPWSATASDASASSPLAGLGREQIPAYELEVAGAVDPANVSPSLVAILGDSGLKMMGYVGTMAFTRDGRELIAGANREIVFWDSLTGRQNRALSGHTDRVDALAISRDGQTLVSGSHDRTVKVWDVASGKALRSLAGHRNRVSAVAISPDGKLVASGDNEIRLWDLAAGPERVKVKPLGQNGGRSVNALAFGRDGRTLVSGGDNGTIEVWDVSTGGRVKTLSVEPVRERWKALAFSLDGLTLATAGYDHGLVLWDTATWAIRHRFPAEDRVGALALAFAGDGRLAVSLGFAARIFDVTTGKEVRRFAKQPVGMNAVAVTHDGATLATTGLIIKLWNIASGQEMTPRLSGHRGAVESVAFSPDGTTLATASADQTIKLWDLATRRERATLEGHTSSVQSVVFSPDGRSVASIGFKPEVMLWDVASGKRVRTWSASGDLGRRVRFSVDGRRIGTETLARNAGRQLAIWDVATGKQITEVNSGDGSYMLSPDGKRLVFAGESSWRPPTRRLLVWDIEREKVERTTDDGVLPSNLGVAALSPDGSVVALAGRNYQGQDAGKPIIVFWRWAEDRPLNRVDGSADHLAFSPDGRSLVGASRGRNAHVWDPRNGTLRETIRVCEAGHFAIRDIAIAPDSRHFAAALGNGTARVFRIQPAPERVEMREPLLVVATRPQPPADLWKQRVGKPAPEINEIKAWAGGQPVRLADLRNKFVLLHFWGESSASHMGELMALHEKFVDQGLVIIVVQAGRVSSVETWQAHATRRPEWGDRELPFRVARDGGGATPIAGTDATAPGPTFAAYGVQGNRQGGQQRPFNLLIGPDGTVLAGLDRAGSLEGELETRMGVKAKVPPWRDRFDRLYALADGQILKRVGPPYPPDRTDYLISASRGWQPGPERSEVFRWDGRLRHRGTMGVYRLQDIIGFVFNLRRGEFDGPAELLGKPIPGDWIIRQGAAPADLLQALEKIMGDELKTPIHFASREVERDVIVAKGRYQFHPLGDFPGERAVHLGTDSLYSEDGGGGGSGTVAKMLDWLGNRVSRLVFDETQSSDERVQWRDHLARTMHEMASGTEAGRTLLDRLLANVSKQTSMTFHTERRKVKVWTCSLDH